MKTLLTIMALVFCATALYAQQIPPTQDVLTVENQIEAVSCKAGREAAAATIVSLQKQVADLQKQLAAMKDPPSKSGTSKH
jgi:hypothetical protein